MTMVQTKQPYYLIQISAFIIVAVVLFVTDIKNKGVNEKVTSFVYMVIGSGICLLGAMGNFSAAGIVFASMYLDDHKIKNIIKLSIMFLLITIKGMLFDATIPQVTALFLMHSTMIMIYYYLFMNKKPAYKIDDDQTKLIVEYLIKGYHTKEIAEKVFMNQATVNKRINRLRDKMKCETLFQLAWVLSQNRQNNSNSDKTKNQ